MLSNIEDGSVKKKKKSQTEAHGDKGTEKTHQATQFKEDL